MDLTADLPFTTRSASRDLTELKLLLLIGAFVVAYFKFTWALRQFNVLSILIGAAPVCGPDDPERERHAQRMARVNSSAGDEFNRGIRSYYFGLATLCWLVSPWLFIAVTAAVVGVLYRRDFASRTLAALRDR